MTKQNFLIQSMAISFDSIRNKMGAETVNDVISIMRDPDFSIDAFNGRLKSARECMQLSTRIVESQLERFGFKKKIIGEPDGTFSTTLYYRDAMKDIKEQLSHANRGNTSYLPKQQMSEDGSATYSHPMETLYAANLYEVIRSAVMCNARTDMFWSDGNGDAPRCFVGHLQMHSDKSSKSLKTSGLISYPIHITLQNFSEPLRRACINSGLSLVGYLPVSFEQTEEDYPDDILPQTSAATTRPIRMRLLHESIEFILSPLRELSYQGFTFTDSHGDIFCCHPVLTNYIADIPEAKDICGIKHGTKVELPCHRCHVPAELLNSMICVPERTRCDTRSRRLSSEKYRELAEFEKGKGHTARSRSAFSAATAELTMVSLAEYEAFLEHSPLPWPMPNAELYSIFTYEPLHNFHLGISKFLKVCMIARLNSVELYTSVGSKTGLPRPFRPIRHALLRGANNILSAIESDSYARGLHIDFSTGEKGSSLNGIFTNEGLRGMLEGKDYRALDMVFPFIAAFFDRSCDEVEIAPMTTLCTSFTDITTSALRYGSRKPWTESEILLLDKFLQEFKRVFKDTFENYHATNLSTIKFHLLGHISEDIRRSGGLRHIEAGPYEAAHTIFKEQYRRTSRRRSNAMDETIRRLDFENSVTNAWNYLARHEFRMARMERRRHINAERAPYMVRDGFSVSLSIMERLLRDALPLVEHVHGQPTHRTVCSLLESYGAKHVSLFRQLGDQGTTVFLKLLRKVISTLSDTLVCEARVKISIVKSAFIYGGFTPTLDDCDKEQGIIRYKRGHPVYRQRILACSSFGPSKKERYTYVLISGEKSLWVAKVLALVRLKETGTTNSSELAFVQYMEYAPNADHLDVVLGCIGLKWATADDNDHTALTDTGSRRVAL